MIKLPLNTIHIGSTYDPPERLDYNEISEHISRTLTEMYKQKNEQDIYNLDSINNRLHRCRVGSSILAGIPEMSEGDRGGR